MITTKNLFLIYLGAATVAVTTIGNLQPQIATSDGTTTPKLVPEVASDGIHQTTCKSDLTAQAENAETYGKEKIVGRVYNVIGNNVYMELDNGSTHIENLTMWERGKLGNIIGSRIVVTPYYCNRVSLDTTLHFTPATPIPVPPLVFNSPTTSTTPLTPRKEKPVRVAPVQETPAPQQSDQISP
jgi:hypothetical protein